MQYELTFARTVIMKRIIEIPEYTDDFQQAALDIIAELDDNNDFELIQREADLLIVPEKTWVDNIVAEPAHWNLKRI